MTERPFDESGTFAARRGVHRRDLVLSRYPFMTLVVAAETILRNLSSWRQGACDAIDAGGLGPSHEGALQPDCLSHGVEMGWGVRLDRTGRVVREIWSVHDILLSFSSAASRSAALIGTI
jgi:hypothetical protein